MWHGLVGHLLVLVTVVLDDVLVLTLLDGDRGLVGRGRVEDVDAIGVHGGA